MSELNQYREKAISDYLVQEMGELTELEKTVLASLAGNTLLTDKIDIDDQLDLSTGQKVADKVASFGGSWKFIISFGVFIFIWIIINSLWLINKEFDPLSIYSVKPYFILLGGVTSTRNYDESKSTGGKRQRTVQERLYDQP